MDPKTVTRARSRTHTPTPRTLTYTHTPSRCVTAITTGEFHSRFELAATTTQARYNDAAKYYLKNLYMQRLSVNMRFVAVTNGRCVNWWIAVWVSSAAWANGNVPIVRAWRRRGTKKENDNIYETLYFTGTYSHAGLGEATAPWCSLYLNKQTVPFQPCSQHQEHENIENRESPKANWATSKWVETRFFRDTGHFRLPKRMCNKHVRWGEKQFSPMIARDHTRSTGRNKEEQIWLWTSYNHWPSSCSCFSRASAFNWSSNALYSV